MYIASVAEIQTNQRDISHFAGLMQTSPKAISFIRFGVFSTMESKFKCAVRGSKQVKFRYTNNSIKDVCLRCEGSTSKLVENVRFNKFLEHNC